MRTWSNPSPEWHGFSPIAYTLDSRKVCELPLKEVKGPNSEPTAVTLGEVYQRLDGQNVTEITDLPEIPMTVKTDRDEVILHGSSFNREMLHVLLTLRNEGINGFDALWFWYDRDHMTDPPPTTAYFFFLVQCQTGWTGLGRPYEYRRLNIVREQIGFHDSPDSGFDPSVFKDAVFKDDHLGDAWLSETDWRVANVSFWYRRFYQETHTGQLMVLRPDEPPLFHYPEGRWRQDIALELLRRRLGWIHSVLWLLVVLAASVVILLWR